MVHSRTPILLVIEDSADDALLVGIAARKAHPGLDVRTVGDGLEGIAYLAGIPPFKDRRAHPVPDLVILDLVMPEVDGFEVLAWIREQGAPPDVPIVVLTSSADPESERRALDLGAAGFHRKPTALEELGSVVREIVDKWIGTGKIIAAHIWAAG